MGLRTMQALAMYQGGTVLCETAVGEGERRSLSPIWFCEVICTSQCVVAITLSHPSGWAITVCVQCVECT